MSKEFALSLGALYKGVCVVCGDVGDFGVAEGKDLEGCKEAVEKGQVYCWDHLPKEAIENARKILHKKLSDN